MTLLSTERICVRYKSRKWYSWEEPHPCSHWLEIDRELAEYSSHHKRRRTRFLTTGGCIRKKSSPRDHWFGLLRLLISALVSSSYKGMVVGANPYSSCLSQLATADSDNDDILTSSEYQAAVEKMSGGTITSSTDSVLDEPFSSRLVSGASGLPINGVHDSVTNVTTDSPLGTFCDAVYYAILEKTGALNTTASESKCFYAMSVADSNRNNQIEQDPEFSRYANQISGNKYGYGIDFSQLPETVQKAFSDFSNPTTSTIDITGSKRGTTPTDDEKTNLLRFCYHTAIAILEGNNPGDSSGDTSTDGSSFEPQFTYLECTRAMAVSDLNRDNLLSMTEYVRLVNRLSSNKYINDDYNSLPSALQEAFLGSASTSTANQIDIEGSGPQQTASTSQTQFLTTFCTEIDKAITSDGANSTNATTDDASGFPFDACTKNMTIADLNKDDKLTQTEYVRFIARISSSIAISSSFTSLDSKLQDNFFNLAGSESADATIDISGSKPNQNPTDQQNGALKNICDATWSALGLNGTGPSGTDNTVNVTAKNIFLIASNSIQLVAINFNDPENYYRKTLESAYFNFLSEILANFTDAANLTQSSQNRFLRSRRREYRYLSGVGLQVESATIGDANDIPCPDEVSNMTSCVLAVGKFVTKVQNDTNTEIMSQQLANVTQKAIGTWRRDNLFQQKLHELNSTVDINIYGDADLTDVNNAAQGVPNATSKSGGGGPSAGVVVGLIITFVVVFGVYVWCCHQKRLQSLKSSPLLEKLGLSKFIGTPKTSNFPKTAATADDDGNDDPNHVDSFDNKLGGKKSVGFTFGTNDGPAAADIDEGSVRHFNVREQEQAPKEDERGGGRSDQPGGGGGILGKVLRRGRNKDESGHFGEGFDNNDDFANYVFDDPTEPKQNAQSDYTNGQDPFGISTSNGWKVEGQSDLNWGGVTDWAVGGEKTGFLEENASEPDSDDDDGSDYESGSEAGPPKGGFGSANEGDVATNVNQLDALVDNGNWGGVTPNFESNLNEDDDPEADENVSGDESQSSEDRSESPPIKEKGNDSFVGEDFDDNSQHSSIIGLTEEELLQRKEYRKQVEELVHKTCPDEIDNIDSMMSQFAGREPELINTLKTMYDRSASQKALKAVHKSKAIPERDGRAFVTGGAEGSAVIAAASMLNSDANRAGDYDEGSYSGSYDSRDRSRSYNSGTRSHSGSRSYDDEGSYTGSRSYDDDRSRSESERSGSRSYDDRGSFSGSFDDADGDSRHSASGSNDDSRSGFRGRKNDNDDQSYTQSDGSENQSRGSRSGSRSYYSEEDDGSRSYDSRSRHSRSHRSDSGSRSGSYSGSGSFD